MSVGNVRSETWDRGELVALVLIAAAQDPDGEVPRFGGSWTDTAKAVICKARLVSTFEDRGDDAASGEGRSA